MCESTTEVSSKRKRLRNYCMGVALTVSIVILLIKYSSVTSLFFAPPLYEASSSEQDLHYAIVIDAGSSGSRAYLYAWPSHSGDPQQLLKISPLTGKNGEPLVKSVSPGLSSLGETPQKAFGYMSPLLDYAAARIPTDRHSSTPLFILATAGMRLIDHEQQEAIMNNLRDGIMDDYKFIFTDANLEIISGKQEGIYQWLAINYVLGKFNVDKTNGGLVNMPDSSSSSSSSSSNDESEVLYRPRTVGAIDMGGASVQIAMEVTSDLQLEGLTQKDKAKVVEVNLGCRDHDTAHRYRLFVNTFLGYGANEAISRYQRHLLLSQTQSLTDLSQLVGLTPDNRLKDPCLHVGLRDNTTLTLDLDHLTGDKAEKVKKALKEEQPLYLVGTGDWSQCYDILKEFTSTSERYFHSCAPDQPSCPDAGMKMPPIPLDSAEFYGFSEFWYTMEDVYRMGGPYIYQKFASASKDFCSVDWSTTYKKFISGEYPEADLERMKTQCIKSSWVTVALHEGFHFPHNFGHLSAAPNTVNGQVVHWTVGALLYRTRFYPLRSSRRLSTIDEMTTIKCPRMSYLYPYPPKTSRFHPWLSARHFFSSVFTSLPFLNLPKRQRRKYTPYFAKALSQHTSTIVGKIVDVETLVQRRVLLYRRSRRSSGGGGVSRPWYLSATVGIWLSILSLHSVALLSSCLGRRFCLPKKIETIRET